MPGDVGWRSEVHMLREFMGEIGHQGDADENEMENLNIPHLHYVLLLMRQGGLNMWKHFEYIHIGVEWQCPQCLCVILIKPVHPNNTNNNTNNTNCWALLELSQLLLPDIIREFSATFFIHETWLNTCVECSFACVNVRTVESFVNEKHQFSSLIFASVCWSQCITYVQLQLLLSCQ